MWFCTCGTVWTFDRKNIRSNVQIFIFGQTSFGQTSGHRMLQCECLSVYLRLCGEMWKIKCKKWNFGRKLVIYTFIAIGIIWLCVTPTCTSVPISEKYHECNIRHSVMRYVIFVNNRFSESVIVSYVYIPSVGSPSVNPERLWAQWKRVLMDNSGQA